MKLGYPTITWGGVVGSPAGVTSVKDLFYRTNGDTERALRDIAAAGYTGTEVFDGNLLDFDEDPEVLLRVLGETGLELVSVYTGANFIFPDILEDEIQKIVRAAELAEKFGASRLVVGGGAVRADGTRDSDFAALAHGLDRVADIAAAHGLESSYHPHLGTLVETPDALERLMQLSRINFCPDTAHLAAGGGDPAEIIRRYSDRLAHVHLKDLDRSTGRFLPLGEGDLDFPKIIREIHAANYDSWLMVELDYYDGNPREAAEISKRFLDTLLEN
ncbi:MAG TPA: sugar phosphate isomerase/epimerase [Marisediminicola sp.]|nr:sugar phosphate isomerase/epimerase [Marisediminicola sp.]